MTCEDCTRARAGIWGTGLDNCTGCRARSVARCMAAFNALDPIGSGDKEELRQTILRSMPDVPYEEARQMVWEWWQVDHATEKKQQ